MPTETGVLILNKNRTYIGPNRSKKYYKCISRNYPQQSILIPYDFKNAKGGVFNKTRENIYIIYEYVIYDEVTNEEAHKDATIFATLKETIGPVNSYEAFEKYELISRNIYNSLNQHNKYINEKIHSCSNYIDYFSTKYNITNTHPCCNLGGKGDIITIDPMGACDLDDAISIFWGENTIEISVYISLVSGWLDYFDNWKYICDENTMRTSTIYLPNGTIRPIFPLTLSHNKMSLLADNTLKPVLTTTIIYDAKTKERIRYIIRPELIYINKNYIYNSTELMSNKTYRELENFTFNHYGELENFTFNHSAHDSHKLVEYWMIQTGLICGEELNIRNMPGIYRECIDVLDLSINVELGWKSYKSKYVLNANNVVIKHDGIKDINKEFKGYVHITSPIRRWVDIWNQSLLLNGYDGHEHGHINEFANHFIMQQDGISIINNKMNEIKKTEKLCFLLHDIINSDNKSIICDGIPFYCKEKNKWKIYLPKYKLWNTLLCDNNDREMPQGVVKCTAIYFDYEHNIRKKIKIMIPL
jgi:hypothetical protein